MASVLAWGSWVFLMFLGFMTFFSGLGPFSSLSLSSSYVSGVKTSNLDLPFHEQIRGKYDDINTKHNVHEKVQGSLAKYADKIPPSAQQKLQEYSGGRINLGGATSTSTGTEQHMDVN